MILVSIIVCTYNRAELLKDCLDSIALQTLESGFFEVLVVDNNSSDNTQEVASRFLGSHQNFRIVKELEQGLSHARNRGWKEAVGEYVAYIDDDALAPPDWVYQIKSFIERQPNVLAFGGPYTSFSQVPLPEWFPLEYGTLNFGYEERQIYIGGEFKEYITGTNMIFKRELFEIVGGFDTGLGMSGDNVSYGEEARFLMELSRKNISIYYVPNIQVSHLIADYKIRLKWLLLSSYKVGRSFNRTFGVERSIITYLSCIAACVLVGSYKFLSLRKVNFKKRIYIAFAPLFVEIGAFVEYFSVQS